MCFSQDLKSRDTQLRKLLLAEFQSLGPATKKACFPIAVIERGI